MLTMTAVERIHYRSQVIVQLFVFVEVGCMNSE